MLSRLLSPFASASRRDGEEDEDSPSPGASNRDYARQRHATADFTEADDDDDESNEDEQEQYRPNRPVQEDEDGLPHPGAVLPLFSSTHLGTVHPIALKLSLLTP